MEETPEISLLTHTEEKPCDDSQESDASPDSNFLGALILDLQPLELWENKFLSKQTNTLFLKKEGKMEGRMDGQKEERKGGWEGGREGQTEGKRKTQNIFLIQLPTIHFTQTLQDQQR